MFKKKLNVEQYGFLVMALGIVIFAATFLLGLKLVLANDLDVYTSYHDKGNEFNRHKYTQTIDAGQLGSNNVANSIDIYMKTCNVTTGNDFSLYKNGSLQFFKGNEGCTTGTTTIRFDTSYTFDNSNTYYWEYEDGNIATSTAQNNGIAYDNGVDNFNGCLSGTNNYTDDWDWCIDGSGEDSNFRIYYDFDYVSSSTETSTYDDYDVSVVELGEEDVFVQIGSESLHMWNVDCFANEPCYLKLGYSYDHIGKNVVIYEVDSDGTNSRNATSTTLQDRLGSLEYTITLDNQATGTIQYFKAYIIDSLEPSNIAKVIWWDKSDYVDTEYFLYDACSDMGSSTWEFWNPTTWAGGMGYAMECAFRKGTYWAFTVKPSTYLKLENSKENILKEFPFNVMFVGKELANIASSTATSTWSIPVNWIASGSSPTSTIATLEFTNENVQNDYGLLWEKFMLMQTIVFYAAGFMIIWVMSLKILKIGTNRDE